MLGRDQISRSERKHFQRLRADGKLCLSAISVWEASMLVRKGRVSLSGPFDSWVRAATSKDVVTIVPITPEVAIAEFELPESMHGDPADRIIVATAIAHDLQLATLDKNLRSLRRVKHYSRKLD